MFTATPYIIGRLVKFQPSVPFSGWHRAEDGRWSNCCSRTLRGHWWTRLPQGRATRHGAPELTVWLFKRAVIDAINGPWFE